MVDPTTIAIVLAGISLAVAITGVLLQYFDLFDRRKQRAEDQREQEERRAKEEEEKRKQEAMRIKEQEEKRRREQQIDFEIERISEGGTGLFAKVLKIRILRPSKTIEHCMVIIEPMLYDYKKLPTALVVADKPEGVLETKVPVGGSADFVVPRSIVGAGLVKVTVRDKDRILRTYDFPDIPETNV